MVANAGSLSDLAVKGQARIFVGRAGQYQRHLARIAFDYLIRVIAAIQDGVRRAGPFRVAQPSLRRRPNLGTSVVLPTSGRLIFICAVHPPQVARVNIQVLFSAQSELKNTASNGKHDNQIDDSVFKPYRSPAPIVLDADGTEPRTRLDCRVLRLKPSLRPYLLSICRFFAPPQICRRTHTRVTV
jgi:hypothetical protein